MTVKRRFEVGDYAFCLVRIELNDVGAQRRQRPNKPSDRWALLRDTVADSDVAARGKEGER